MIYNVLGRVMIIQNNAVGLLVRQPDLHARGALRIVPIAWVVQTLISRYALRSRGRFRLRNDDKAVVPIV